jgi:hypothetical protein
MGALASVGEDLVSSPGEHHGLETDVPVEGAAVLQVRELDADREVRPLDLGGFRLNRDPRPC